jgi:hypothetical protein
VGIFSKSSTPEGDGDKVAKAIKGDARKAAKQAQNQSSESLLMKATRVVQAQPQGQRLKADGKPVEGINVVAKHVGRRDRRS